MTLGWSWYWDGHGNAWVLVALVQEILQPACFNLVTVHRTTAEASLEMGTQESFNDDRVMLEPGQGYGRRGSLKRTVPALRAAGRVLNRGLARNHSPRKGFHGS